MLDAVDLQKDLVQMPFVTRPRTPLSQAIGVQMTELVAPGPDAFVADHNAACRHRIFHVAKADRESVVEPDRIRNDFSREAMAAVRVVGHSFSIPSVRVLNLTMPCCRQSGLQLPSCLSAHNF